MRFDERIRPGYFSLAFNVTNYVRSRAVGGRLDGETRVLVS
jgi:hypothetical protein